MGSARHHIKNRKPKTACNHTILQLMAHAAHALSSPSHKKQASSLHPAPPQTRRRVYPPIQFRLHAHNTQTDFLAFDDHLQVHPSQQNFGCRRKPLGFDRSWLCYCTMGIHKRTVVTRCTKDGPPSLFVSSFCMPILVFACRS
jgi:hypothetical protein